MGKKVQYYKGAISKFISSEQGQRFFNFAYSIGAAIVIWGALFKILHLPGGNALLSIGMGTEVLMFVLTAFDRPPREYKWEEVFPAFRREEDEEEGDKEATDAAAIAAGTPAHPVFGGPTPAPGTPQAASQGAQGVAVAAPAAPAAPQRPVDLNSATEQYLEQMTTMTQEMQKLHDTTAALNQVSEVLLQSYRSITENASGIDESSRGYVDQMQALHHNLGGLNTIYELQLRSVSSQIDAIDRVNRGIKDIRDMYEKSANQSARYCEETERMARYMQQLNSIYERMIQAMTVNMYRPGMPGMEPPAPAPQQPAAPEANNDNQQ